jgi:hypothetical protein
MFHKLFFEMIPLLKNSITRKKIRTKNICDFTVIVIFSKFFGLIMKSLGLHFS